MAKSKDRDKVLGGMAWKLAERFSAQGVAFVVSVILARILLPEQYGVIAMVNIFVVFANVFITGGLNSSLIQKKDADEIDFSTMFYCTLSVSIMLYIILYFTAPFLASFYKMPELVSVTRVLSLTLIIQSYQTIQQAYVSRKMIFKKNFYATLSGTLLSGVIGIIMAYMGLGVWALVAQTLSSILINTLTLFLIVDWKPKLLFSWKRAKALMNYGSKILMGNVIGTVYKEIRKLLIGSAYTPTDLAYYSRGANLPHLVTTNLDSTIRTVLFPAMANYSNDTQRVKQMLRRSIQNTAFVTYFFLTIMAVASEPIVRVLLTDKWLPCVPYMQILCFTYMIQTVSATNVEALKAIGKSNEVLKLEVFKKPVFLLVVLASVPFGVKAIVLTSPINALYALYMNFGPTAKNLNYSRMEQFKDLIPGFLMALGMAIVTFPISFLPLNDFLVIVLQLGVGFLSYILMSVVFKVQAFYYIKQILLDTKKRKAK